MTNTQYREYLIHTAPTFLHGIFTGAVVGVLIFFFRMVAEELIHLSRTVYGYAQSNPLYAALLFLGLVCFAVLMSLFHLL